MRDIKVIVCGPAIGKTYLARNDSRFVDLDDERAKYKYDLWGVSDFELESGKFNRSGVSKKDTSEYIKRRIDEELIKGKIILLSYHEKILEYVRSKDIGCCLVYASLDSRDEYVLRMKNRGNKENFIEGVANEKVWEEFYSSNVRDSRYDKKIELKRGQYLSDVVSEIISYR